MISSLLALMTAMSIDQAPVPGVSALRVYGQNVPIQVTVIQYGPDKSEIIKPPIKKNPNNLGIATTGKSVFVADVASGGILYAKAPHEQRSIASLTKLMTAIVALENESNLKQEMTFQDSDFDHQGEAVFQSGDTLTRGEVLRAMLVGSVNAAANMLARTSHLTREDFVQRMNEKARDLHLNSMKFADPSGLNSQNKSNAADIAALATLALNNQEIRKAMTEPEVSVTTKAGKAYNIKSTNLLLSSFLNKDPYKIVGAKTGSLPEAGYCLAQVTKDKQGHEIVAVLLGSDNHFSRYNDVKALTSWAFDSYQWGN